MNKYKGTVRLCVTVFLLTMGVLLLAVGVYTVDTVSGRLLYGATYQSELSLLSVTAYLPVRWQALWQLLKNGC